MSCNLRFRQNEQKIMHRFCSFLFYYFIIFNFFNFNFYSSNELTILSIFLGGTWLVAPVLRSRSIFRHSRYSLLSLEYYRMQICATVCDWFQFHHLCTCILIKQILKYYLMHFNMVSGWCGRLADTKATFSEV